MPDERPKDYQKLIDKRDNTIRALKYHEIKVAELNDNQHIEALARLNFIENVYEKFTNACDALENHEEFTYSDLTVPNEDIVEIFITLSAKLKIMTKELLESSLLNSTTNARNTAHVEVKLPQISIPTFSGDYKEWPAFYDAFVSLVDSNGELRDVNKMHYLRSSLKGTAFSLISRMKVTEANYAIALRALVDRFENKRAIVNECLKDFINQTAMKNRSAKEIRSLIDTTKETLQCIETLRISIDEWGPFVVYIVQTKMDDYTRSEFENYLGGSTEIPRYKILEIFLETQFRIVDGSSVVLSSSEHVNNTRKENTYKQIPNNIKRNQPHMNEKCPLCSNDPLSSGNHDHWLLNCPKFLEWSPQQCRTFAINNNSCIICLHSHEKDQCKSKYRCKKCGGAHCSKLHVDDDFIAATSNSTSVATIHSIQEGRKLFATAIVKVKDKFDTNHLLRVFIDMGSGGAFISERAVQLLCLPRKNEYKSLTGVDNTSLGNSTNSVQLHIESTVNEAFKLTLKTSVLRTIIQLQKFEKSMATNWNHLKKIELADPNFMNPSHIDLLFGVDIYGLIIKDGVRKGLVHEPVAQNSHLGWLVLGATAESDSVNVKINSISIQNELKKFWENEEVLVKPIMTEEQVKCVEHFNKTHTRLPDGSFMVSIPFNMNPLDPNFLGESKRMALCRLFQIEKRFKRDPLYKKRYHEEVNGYLERNHMSQCKLNTTDGYFLPHHAVVRESSTTTKQRTVYDASAKSLNGFSLNDRCLNGPTIQPDLFDIFIRWRTHKIALNADIEKNV